MNARVVVLDTGPDAYFLDAERARLVYRLHRERTLAWARAVAPGGVLLSGSGAPPDVELIPAAQTATAGERVAGASEVVFARAPGPVLFVGVRCWALSAAHARDALSDLGHGCDLVVGPATGGGLYLLGVREQGPARLAAEVLSSPTLLGSAFAAANEHGLSVGMLRSERELTDADGLQALLRDPLTPAELLNAMGAGQPPLPLEDD